MPIFALANAGVNLNGLVDGGQWREGESGRGGRLARRKPVGVVATSALALRGRLAVLPAGVGARHLLVLGVVAGIGFTMSLFLAQLAFDDPALLGAAKLGVLVASGLALIIGLILGTRAALQPERCRNPALSAQRSDARSPIDGQQGVLPPVT